MATRDILLFLITTYCSVVALKRPFFGLLAYVCYSLLAPHSLTWGPASTFSHVLVIGVCTIVGFFLSAERKNLPRDRELFFLVALWATFGFSTIFAFRPAEAFSFFQLISKSLLMVFIAISLIDSEERVRMLARVIAFSIGFYALKIGLFVIRTGGQGAVYGPDNSFLLANNSLGMALAMNVPFLFYLAKMESGPWLRRIAAAMLVFSYPAVIGTFSRGAWLGLAVATVLLVLKSKHRVLGIIFSILLVMSSPLWISNLVSEQIAARYGTLKDYEEDGSAISRFWNWDFCTRVGLSNPLTGGGFYLYSPEAYVKYFSEFFEHYPDKVWSCHNTWLAMLAEHGLPGFVLWIGLLGSALLSLRQLKMREHNSGPQNLVTNFSDMLQIALASYMVTSTFVDVGYYEGLYFALVMVIAMKEVARRQRLETSALPLTAELQEIAISPRVPLAKPVS